MMKKPYLLLFIVLAGCSAESGSDKTADPARKVTPQQAALVRVVDGVPTNVARFSNLSATLCREGPLGAPPTREAALLLLKTRTLQNGFLTVHSVTVGPVEGSLAKSCPGGIQARGVGFSTARPKG
jgi:hypothetical protein